MTNDMGNAAQARYTDRGTRLLDRRSTCSRDDRGRSVECGGVHSLEWVRGLAVHMRRIVVASVVVPLDLLS